MHLEIEYCSRRRYFNNLISHPNRNIDIGDVSCLGDALLQRYMGWPENTDGFVQELRKVQAS